LTATPDTHFENRIREIGSRWILGKKASKDHLRNPDGSVALWLPDKALDSSNWVSILMVGKGCSILRQDELAEMRKTHHVMMRWPEHGGVTTRYMHQVSELLWVVHEVLIEDGPLHMIDPYIVPVPKE